MNKLSHRRAVSFFIVLLHRNYSQFTPQLCLWRTGKEVQDQSPWSGFWVALEHLPCLRVWSEFKMFYSYRHTRKKKRIKFFKNLFCSQGLPSSFIGGVLDRFVEAFSWKWNFRIIIIILCVKMRRWNSWLSASTGHISLLICSSYFFQLRWLRAFFLPRWTQPR